MSAKTTVTITELADCFGVTTRYVQQLVTDQVLPKPAVKGAYDLLACCKAMVAHLKSERDPKELQAEKIRLTRAQADKAEIEIARMEGELIPLADAERVWCALVGAFRAKMLTVPYRAAVESAGKSEKEIERIVEDMVYEALTELSNWKPDEEEPEGGE